MSETIIWCPFCECIFTGTTWVGGVCVNCGEEYEWDEACTEDYSDCWTTVEWDFDGQAERKLQGMDKYRYNPKEGF